MKPEIIETIAHLRARTRPLRLARREVGLVPTMGALHEGHARLIERARLECDLVVVSIFVNPLQFDRKDDLERYPRALDADVELCAALGVDVVFAPGEKEMYPSPPSCAVEVGRVADHLCGRHRPGHFRGVATVVLKLLEIVQPDRVYFGEKDAQQLAVVQHMVRDFNVPVRVVPVPTVRESDGLAMSSRNQRLTPEERTLAVCLYRALSAAQRRIRAGATDAESVKAMAAAEVPSDPRLRLEYLEIVDSDDMQPVNRIERRVLAAGALWVGATRLIDNVWCDPPDRRVQKDPPHDSD